MKINQNKEFIKHQFLPYVIREGRSKTAYIFLIIAFLPLAFWLSRELIPNQEILGLNLKQVFDINFNGFDPKIWKGIRGGYFLYYLLVISIFEISSRGRHLKKRYSFNNLSLFRMRFSEGAKFADLYYFFIGKVHMRIPYLATAASFGFSKISNSWMEFLNSYYEQIIPDTNKKLNIFILFIIAMLLYEFGEYIGHRIAHRYFWDFHEFHHSATEMNILNGVRLSFFEKLFISFPGAPFLIISNLLMLKATQEGYWFIFWLYLFWILGGEFFMHLGHSSAKVVFPKPFSYILLSPSLHWLHHSTNPDHFNKNFGRVLCIWDRLFGSYLDESHLKDITGFGVGKSEYNMRHPLYSYYILPINILIKKFKKLLRLRTI